MKEKSKSKKSFSSVVLAAIDPYNIPGGSLGQVEYGPVNTIWPTVTTFARIITLVVGIIAFIKTKKMPKKKRFIILGIIALIFLLLAIVPEVMDYLENQPL